MGTKKSSAPRRLRQPKEEVEARVLEVPPARYLCLAGEGPLLGGEFQRSVEAIERVGGTIRLALAKSGRKSFELAPLEALWERSRWKLLMRVPDLVTGTVVELARHLTRAPVDSACMPEITLLQMTEGESVEVLHVGPEEDETRSLAKIQALMAARGLEPSGPHHEIYLSDPRVADTQQRRTILRQPVCAARNAREAW